MELRGQLRSQTPAEGSRFGNGGREKARRRADGGYQKTPIRIFQLLTFFTFL